MTFPPLFGGSDDVFLTPNKGQWHPAVQYKAQIPAGVMYMDDQGFTFHLYDAEALEEIHTEKTGLDFSEVRSHVVKTRFKNALPPDEFEQSAPSDHYSNYFLGNDSSRWASGVHSFSWVKRKQLYEGIDLKLYRNNGELKYDLILEPEASADQIQLDYDGADSLKIIDGQLHVYTSVRHYIEQPPFAYQMFGAQLKRVPCHYQLSGTTLTFEFPEDYDQSKTLVIDPEISFSSYVGSGTSSFGYTATYDDDGHLYAGAIVFGNNYPVTAGAFDDGFNDGTIDIGISKFSSDGTQLIYSTFLGGDGNESPHSLVVNENNELFVLGSTGSSDFPTTPASYSPGFNLGNSFDFNIAYGFTHLNGTDIIVTKLNAEGTDLLASTFIGGTGNDGISLDPAIEYNYGDAFRGEIIVDNDGFVYVASVTDSEDFPTTPGAAQPTYGGGISDGCVFKLNPDLSEIVWATYHGGSGGDATFSLQRAEDGSVYVAGATISTNLPMGPEPLNGNFLGNVDGFVSRFSENGQNLLAGTYIGTNSYDEAFFVQLDTEGDVFVVGQTEGDYPVIGDVYNNPSSGQFVQKLDPNLTTSLLSTVVGNGNGGPNISIAAFLVSNCNQIYISGWGGNTNQSAGGVFTSTTDNLPVTADAFQPNTDGSDFYLMVLSPDAEELVYATFFGGGSSNEHVDGGTSRFDKRGTVYQAVCAGCGGNDDFPTQPGVWSEVNASGLGNGGCNLGVFKFDLSTITASISIDGPSEVCIGDEVSFINNSSVSDEYEWDFGGVGVSNEITPTFSFDESGDYTISMIATHSNECIEPDTTSIEITVLPPPDIAVSPATTICPGDTVEIFVEGEGEFTWSPAGQLDDHTSATPAVWAETSTTFSVLLNAACGEATATVDVEVWEEDFGTGSDQEICLGQSAGISAFGGGTYEWTPAASLNDADNSNPQASPEESTTYDVIITSPNGCVYSSSVFVNVLPGLPEVETIEEAAICSGGSVTIWASGGDEYEWDPTPGLSDYNISNPIANPTENTWYTVNVSNLCGTVSDTVLVNIGVANAGISPPDTACPGIPNMLQASGGIDYQWQPQSFIDDPHIANPMVSPPYTMTYSVTVTDQYGCADVASVVVPVFDPPYVFDSGDEVAEYYTYVEVDAQSNGELYWESDDLPLSCNECPSPEVHATETGVVYVIATDENGCTAMDSLLVEVIGSLYVPNAFTPNGDGINDQFKAVGSEIEEFHLQIYDRWGELIFETDDIDQGWNGGVNRHYVESEVYVWEIVAKEHTGVSFEKRGHVTVIR